MLHVHQCHAYLGAIIDIVEPAKLFDMTLMPKQGSISKIIQMSKPATKLSFDNFNISDLHKQLKRKCNMMDDVASHYFEAYIEAKRLKNQFKELYQDQVIIQAQLKLRECLQIRHCAETTDEKLAVSN